MELHARPRVHRLPLGADDLPEVVERCTRAISELLDDPPAVLLTGSCSDALAAAATLVGVGPGDEVVVPAFAFPTAIAPFAAAGATIRFADVSSPAANLDPASVADRLGPRTRAVVAMHYGGIGAVGAELRSAIDEVGADLVEDAAHGLFARWDGRPLGTIGRFGALSFHRTKNLSALDGGALVVNREDDVDAAAAAVDKGTDRAAFFAGRTTSYEWQRIGGAWRMGEGAVRYLAEELAFAEDGQRRRRTIAATYRERLASWATEVGVGLPVDPPEATSPAHLFHLVLPAVGDRPGFVEHCAAAGVEVARHYGSMPTTPFGRTLRRPSDATPVADDLARRLVRLPLHPDLDDDAVDRVVEAVRGWRPGAGGAGA